MEISACGTTLVLTGDLDARSTSAVRDALHAHLARHAGSAGPVGPAGGPAVPLVVDLTGVDNADLTALRMLAAAAFLAERDGHPLRLRGTRPGVRRLLQVSRLARVVRGEVAPAAPAEVPAVA